MTIGIALMQKGKTREDIQVTDVRIPAPTSTWYLPKQAFLTAKHFAYQYQEWKDELSTVETGLGSPNFDGMPHGNYLSNPTAEIAER